MADGGSRRTTAATAATTITAPTKRRQVRCSPRKKTPSAIATTGVTYAYVETIPSGAFAMGSPDTEPHRNADEGPQHTVKVDAFFMEEHEVTWAEYYLFILFPVHWSVKKYFRRYAES